MELGGRRCNAAGARKLPSTQDAVLTAFLHQQTRAPAFTNATRFYASDAKATPTEVSSILEQRIRGVQEETSLSETGRVLSVGYDTSPLPSPPWHISNCTVQGADRGTVTVLPVSTA